MKHWIMTICLVLGGFISAQAQSDTDLVVRALKTGNPEMITTYLDDFVDLKLLDKDEVKNMSKNQAAMALKSFFSEQNIKGFEKVSEGGKGNLIYILGKLTTSGKSFNITVQLKQKAGNFYIITMRIS
ncbi:DUF4783 domain-containing protein [Sediminibacterium sp. TEGAF015]|uniref:DUF4783 domain-containing protein n=1 Tax=Sediminibacterium sp. TEGAF015 TaxID=575378 RepID=UPI002202B261|nr:DUF4783 domain-containing protein [Sediminibacterium sp. TEGAF015]BDQ12316.1 hypothetical protein TEGAF0_15330 [Sediminibacterium sp. TEGAF015]